MSLRALVAAAALLLSAAMASAAEDDRAPETATSGCVAARRAAEGGIVPPRRARAWVERDLADRAAQGDPEAAFEVGLRHFYGECVQRSYAEAHRWFERAAAGGGACAAGAAAHLRAAGLGVERDPRAAREGFRAAQEAGCRRAFYLQALAEEASLRPERRQTARELLERGAALGDGHALNLLGVEREREEDRGAAEALYRRAAAAGNRAAPVNLKRLDLYFSQRSRKEPLETLQRRAQAREPSAQFALGQRYHRGDGVSSDYVEAMKLYRLAAEAKFPPAMEMVALILSRLDPRNPALIDVAWMRLLAYVQLSTDEEGKRRGVLQPVVDDDPFYGMEPHVAMLFR